MSYDMFVYNLDYVKICNLFNNQGSSPKNVIVKKRVNEIPELSFQIAYSNPQISNIINGNLIEFDGQIYEIITPVKNHENNGAKTMQVSCRHYCWSLKCKQVIEAESDPLLPEDALKLVLYTGLTPKYGWTIGTITSIGNYRGFSFKEQTAYECLSQLAEIFNSYLDFSAQIINGVMVAVVNFYDREDISSFEPVRIDVNNNLRNVSVDYDTSEMATRLYCFGGTNPTTNIDVDLLEAVVNGVPWGKTYVENYLYYLNQGYTQQYILNNPNIFLKESVWRDSNYIDAATLYVDAVKKLDILSQPRLTIKFSSLDFRMYDYGMQNATIGSPVFVKDENIGILVQCIVTAITRNHDTPWLYEFEVSNAIDYNNVLRSLIQGTNVTNLVINQNGTIKEEAAADSLDPIRQEIADLINTIGQDSLSEDEETAVDDLADVLYGDNPPILDIKLLRDRTPIDDKKYWQEVDVATATAASTSIAIKKVGDTVEKIFVAYTIGDIGYIKSSNLGYPVSLMQFTTNQVITDCTKIAIDFDGSFVYGDYGVEYRTFSTPYIMYTNTATDLMYGELNGEFTNLTGNVTTFDLIRGIASRLKDDDQGIIVFYVIEGELYYDSLLAGVWQGQQSVDLAPSGIVEIRVERLFDYRFCIHCKTNDGKLYELYNKMSSSGWNSSEYITASVLDATVIVIDINYADYFSPDEYITAGSYSALALPYGDVSPVMRDAWNYDDENGDYGFYVCLRWTDTVDQALPTVSEFTMTDGYGMTWYPQEVIRSDYPNRLLLKFMNFNNALNPLVVNYIPGTLTWLGSAIAADTIQFTATNLVPYYVDPPVVSSVYSVNNRTIRIEFDKPIIQLLSQSGFAVSGFEPFTSPEGQLVATNYVNELISLYDTYTVQIYLTYAGRLKHPQGNVNVLFTGQLLGVGGAMVESFSEDFIPTGLTLWFKPNDPEYITTTPQNATIIVFSVNYMSAQNADEYLKAGVYGATIVITNVGGLPL